MDVKAGRFVIKTSLSQRKKNLENLDEVSERRKFIKAMERGRVKFICRLLKHNQFLTNILRI